MSEKEWRPADLAPNCWYDVGNEEFTTRDDRGNYLFHDRTGNCEPWVVPERFVATIDGKRCIQVDGAENVLYLPPGKKP